MTFGAYLRKLRAAKEMSQAALATRLGVSQSYLCHIEHDSLPPSRRPSLHLITKMAEALNADVYKMLLLAERVPRHVRAMGHDNRMLLEILLRLNDQQFADGVYRSILRFLQKQEGEAS